MEQIIRKPEFLRLQSLHKAQTEQIYLKNMRRALNSVRRGNVLIKTNDYGVVNGSALSVGELSGLAAGTLSCV